MPAVELSWASLSAASAASAAITLGQDPAPLKLMAALNARHASRDSIEGRSC